MWLHFLYSFVLYHFVTLVCFAVKFETLLIFFSTLSKCSHKHCTSFCLDIFFCYCAGIAQFSTVVLKYQYQDFSIVFQYNTARFVHPWIWGYSALVQNVQNTVSYNFMSSPFFVLDLDPWFILDPQPQQTIILKPISHGV